VRSEFLEKTALQYFSIPDLHHAMSHGGYLDCRGGTLEAVRADAVPILSCAIAEIAKRHMTGRA
jgi:hypothetical protein